MERSDVARRAIVVASGWLLLAAVCVPGGRCGVRFGTMGAVKSAGEALDEESAARGAAAASVCSAQQLAQLEQSMSTILSTSTLTDFTLLLESADGRSFSYSKGSSSGGTLYESASTSKLVTAAVILSLVDRGTFSLTLDSRPQDFISWWSPPSTSPAYGVTLRRLLSFTSGLEEEPPPTPVLSCLDNPLNNFESCVQEIYALNVSSATPPPAPGSQFYYSSTHLQIAGLMAVKARGMSDVSYSSWTAVFNEFKSRTGLFGSSVYNKPSAFNPRLAGGMTWTGNDYLAFLRALYSGDLLSVGMRAELFADQRGSATVTGSPLSLAPPFGLGEDWRYGLGNWLECEPGTSCSSAGRNSSPGAFGAYPFIDFSNGYFGILARQDVAGSFPDGVNLFRTAQATAARWATKSCGN